MPDPDEAVRLDALVKRQVLNYCREGVSQALARGGVMEDTSVSVDTALRLVADEYFGPDGVGDMMIDDVSHTHEFIAGQRRGHEDAHAVLHGVADRVQTGLDHE